MTPWVPSVTQTEAWTEINQEIRTYSPDVFSLAPTFDTGSVSGIWTAKAKEAEVWTSA